ncbi:hypothetical protein GCK72_006737 [Caenorhabditis remanei]|uniref:Uncharacterized protein n=1 Tax=Caenorhabditis remanei TaxID=31234 RepID=A0A6A5HHE9_CAERE|nr:hypothetical protein GCK72_006737 [Caenorhabditis remanei]KAF1766779.1 hypothetical protein GCK72_006737 [Caenorhabditis remanei]
MGSSWSRKKPVQRTVDIETEKKRVTTNERGSQYNVTAGGNVYFLGNSPNFSTSPEFKKRPCPLEDVEHSTDSPQPKRRRFEASEKRGNGVPDDFHPRTGANVPKTIPLTKKEEAIAAGLKVDRKAYQTMNDVESDWNSIKKKKTKGTKEEEPDKKDEKKEEKKEGEGEKKEEKKDE